MPNQIPIFPEGISGYELIAFCGFGAYGSVWLVKDETGRQHALKVIDQESLQEKELRGLEASSRIANCPNLLQIHHVAHFDGGLFYTMEPGDNAGTKEHYEPDTLARRLKQAQDGLPLAEVRQLAIDLLKALAQLHASNLVHRDIKPENILYVGGQPKLSDLGLLRSLSLTVSIGGTLGYIPPDKLIQAANSPQFNLRADSSDDLYAMGKLLYCALTGNSPDDFPAVSPEKMKDEEYRRFFKVLLFACGNRPYPHRFDTAEHFLEAIQCGKLPRRRTWLIWLPLLLLVISALAYFCLPHKQKPEKSAQSASIQQDSTLQTELENRLAKTFHIEVQLSSEEYAPVEQLLSTARAQMAQKNLKSAQVTITTMDKGLAETAIKNIPQNTGDDFHYAASIFGYLQSPLGKYLSNEQRDALLNQATKQAEKLSVPDSPCLGKTFNATELSLPLSMPFVPPGKFVSSVTGKVEEISYPFWIFERETTNGQYLDHMRYISSREEGKTMPVTLMSWYDILSYCASLAYSLNLGYQIPPGYTLRPATEAEWEYAAQGGWAGQNPRPESIRESVLDIKTPNKLGLYGFGSNFTEYTMAGTPEDFSSLAVRGIFGNGKDKRPERYVFRRSAMNMPHATFRPVLAPTPPDFFQREMSKMPVELVTATINGRHYACIPAFAASMNLNSVLELATSLKARLTEPVSIEEWTEIFTRIGDQPSFPAYIGAHWSGNAWRRLSDDKPFEIPDLEPPRNGEMTALYGTSNKLTPVNPKRNLPTVIFTWN
ncbi:MAG: SUMF1/EgtB/PvdO family nonheme iron enzyme, partial [Victivallales bacterium]|nr:SUMF1/EgtB/PvdO family nonheme iron enzyme [Victivallales bacterium]